ncbi:MAG: hypothetical protein M5U11_09550 [Anaerolineales bacterium]|nr:hypothetical protein [Anaerolineales bacterium]MCZ2289754.1 hypothetical protein [Anaerolineales bacterium]MCZ7549373.1 hypothetical protein [Anaerolineales bacterium]MDX9938223.1 hypothetical protein [Anaerolineales bacterium]
MTKITIKTAVLRALFDLLHGIRRRKMAENQGVDEADGRRNSLSQVDMFFEFQCYNPAAIRPKGRGTFCPGGQHTPKSTRLPTCQRVPRTEWTRWLAGMKPAEAKRKEVLSPWPLYP